MYECDQQNVVGQNSLDGLSEDKSHIDQLSETCAKQTSWKQTHGNKVSNLSGTGGQMKPRAPGGLIPGMKIDHPSPNRQLHLEHISINTLQVRH